MFSQIHIKEASEKMSRYNEQVQVSVLDLVSVIHLLVVLGVSCLLGKFGILLIGLIL